MEQNLVKSSDMGQVFEYSGTNVAMRVMNGEVQVCVSDFAKAFPKKNLSQIVNSKEIQDYVARMSELKNYSSLDLLEVKRGNAKLQGTWAHQRVALRIAQKLSTDFSIWVDERIEELARHGFTATPQTLEQIINNPDVLIRLATQLKQEREENARLLNENESQKVIISQQTEEIKKSAPKVEYYDNTLQSVNTYTTTQIAKELGYNSANILNGLLRKAGIQYYQSGTYLLHVPYSNWRLHSVKTYTFTRNDGSIGTRSSLVWTERGRFFINALHKYAFDVKLAIKYIKGETL